MSSEELLYAASLEDNASKKAEIYKKTAEVYPNDYRAYNNLAVLSLNEGNESAAKNYLNKALAVNNKAPEAYANKAYIELQKGNLDAAEKELSEAIDANNFNQVLGNLNIARGNYSNACEELADIDSNSLALAQILNKDYANAAKTLKRVENADALTSYLKAIVAARQGNNSEANKYLQEAAQKDSRWAEYAKKDLEFAKLSK